MMSAKNLRDSILQMAVEGKLVEQREEEGTAADLLASIREQRAQLVREKKAKPLKGGESVIWRDDDGHWFERRGKGEAVCIDDEIPFDIPDSWCWARLGQICSKLVDGDHNPPRKSLMETPFVMLSASNVKDGYVDFNESVRYLDEGQYQESARRISLASGDLLLTIVGTIGRSCVVGDKHDFVLQRSVAVLKPMFNVNYMKIVLDSPFVQYLMHSEAAGTAQKGFYLKQLAEVRLPIPPLVEQSRIVSKLDELTPLVEEYGKAQERRDQLDHDLPIKLRKSILQAVVEGKLTEQSDDDEPASMLLAGIREKRAQLVREGKAKPVKGGESIIYRDDAGHWFERRGKSDPVCIDEEIPFDIPDSWSWARLGDLIDLRSGIDLDKKLYSDTERIGIPYITGASNLQNGQVLENRWTDSPKRKSMKGDLLLTCKGTIGEMAYNPFPVAHIARQIMAIKAIDDRMLGYIRLFLLFYVDKIKKAAKGIIPGIERADVTGALIPTPALAEQCRIVEKVDAALQQANTHL